MAQITKEQIKRVYALGGGLGIVERNNKDDPLHQIVFGISGKESIKELTDKEFHMIEHELMERMKLSKHSAPLKKKKPDAETVAGMMTKAQIGFAWHLMYDLCELDKSSASVSERMFGAIKKELGITAAEKKPFQWVSFEQGTKLIEQLKRYVRSAERKAKAKAGVG